MPFLFTVALSATAAELTVGPGGFANVATALEAADDGDRILLTVDVFESVLLVDQVVDFVADGGPVRWTFPDGGVTALLIDVTGGAVGFEGIDFALDSQGALLRATDATITLTEITSTATVGQTGSAINALASDVVISTSTFTHGSAVDGGFIYGGGGSTIDVVFSTFRGGVAENLGGAMHIASSTLQVTDTLFEDGQAANGSAVVLQSSVGALTRSRFCNNATDTHHTVFAEVSELHLVNSLFFDNDVVGHGVLDLTGGTHEVLNNVFAFNAAGTGSAVSMFYDDATVLFQNNLVWGNAAEYGAAVSLADYLPESGFETSYNLYYENTPAHSDQLDATDVVDVDPLVLSIGCDTSSFIPAPDSPLIDGGAPEVLDEDGTRSDIGLFGGPDAAPAPVPDPDPDPEPIDADGDGVSEDLDCDDGDPAVAPGLVEVPCDERDNDCDPATPDAPDLDGDSQSVCAGDCDDADAARWTGAGEVRDDGIDQDCDGSDLQTSLTGPAPCGCQASRTPALGRGGWALQILRRRPIH